jgi:hypothetical protein
MDGSMSARVQLEAIDLLGRRVRYTEKMDGSMSARVQLEAIDLLGRVGDNRVQRAKLIHAIAELEAATKELRLATATGAKEWVEYARRRQRAANQAVTELQQ